MLENGPATENLMRLRPVPTALKILCLAFLGIVSFRAPPLRAENVPPISITAVTEEFPPFQFVQDGKLTGWSVEVVETAIARAGMKGEIELRPWARAIKEVQDRPNVLLFSISRTTAREKQYKWVGQINEDDSYLYALAERDIQIATLDDAKRYTIGTLIGDVTNDYLRDHGFIPGQNLVAGREHSLNYAMLKAGHIDLWAQASAAMSFIVRQAGDDPATSVRPVFKITDMAEEAYSGDFMAFGLQTSDAVVEQLRQALDKMKADGTYAAIQKKWTQ